MPPKKAKAAHSPPLKDFTIAFASSSIPAGEPLKGTKLEDLKAEITRCGESQFNKKLTKISEALNESTVKIVGYAWLEESFKAKAPVSETDHLLTDKSNQASQTNGTSAEQDTKDTKATKSKGDKKDAKVTTTNGTAVKAEDDDEADASNTKKRKRNSADSNESSKSYGSGKEMNVTKQLDMNIPLDHVLMSYHGSQYKVHIGDDSAIYDVTLNQSNAGENANKFYIIQLLKTPQDTWYTWTRWGRVGESGQNKLLGDGSHSLAMREFESKFKSKTGNSWADRSTGSIKKGKYVFIERSYEDSDSEGEDGLPGASKRKKVKKEDADDDELEIKSKLPEPVQELIKLIFNKDYFNNTYADYDYDANKMPLGKLSKASLMRGYGVLKDLAAIVGNANASRDEIEDLSNQYLSLIPKVVSRSSRPPVLDTTDKLKKELELLENLTDMQLANDLMKGAKKSKEEISLIDQQYSGLGMQEMTPLDRSKSEFKDLEAYLTKSVGHTHGTKYQVQDIFRIERDGETARFDSSSYSKIKNKNRRLLWHGSRATNFGGILSQGLRIAPPEAPVSGYMFGKGVYLADMSSKSANYCCSYSSGNTGLLLLCEAELGDPPLKLTNADYEAGEKAKADNKLSTWGVGQTAPQVWKDAGSVHKSLAGVSMPDVVSKAPGPTNEAGSYLQYNEFIVYDVAQIKLRYLFRVKM